VVNLRRLGEPEEGKGFGYGVPVRVDYELPGGGCERAVLHTMRPGSFGHENMLDRERILLWSHQAYNRLPRHVRSVDVSVFQSNGDLTSLGQVEELGLLTEYAEGAALRFGSRAAARYRQADRSRHSPRRCGLRLLVEIHAERGAQSGNDSRLYIRRIRELVGDGECIMGLADSYPPHRCSRHAFSSRSSIAPWRGAGASRIELTGCEEFMGFSSLEHFVYIGSRFSRAGSFARRVWRSGRRRDVYHFELRFLLSLQRTGKLEGAFGSLFLRFWDRYLEKVGDREILEVAAPFFVFRALALASPVSYPSLADSERKKLLAFILAVVEPPSFNPRRVNLYCGT
jgi:hypothetical protein